MKGKRSKFIAGLASIVLGLVLAGTATAATLNVCKFVCTYSTIQSAIDVANPGDTVLVDDGVYTENINFLGKAITVQSVNGAGSTTIDGNQTGSVVTFENNELSSAVLKGFTITNGSATGGGGIRCSGSSPSITNCTITGNSASNSGGISCATSSPTITNCIISGNTANWEAGGIRCYNNSSATIINCTISNNTAFAGGGIYCNTSSSAAVVNSILWGDCPDEIYVDGTSFIDITYSDIQGGWTGSGNIDADPLFVGGGDYHLTVGSPCIDAGDPASASPAFPADDIDGDVRPQGLRYDIGADEFAGASIAVKQLYSEDITGAFSFSYVPGDDITVNAGIKIQGDPASLYDMQVRYFLIDSAGNNTLLGVRLYRNYSPGNYYIYQTAVIPAGAVLGQGVIRAAALLAQGASLLDRSSLAGYVDVE